VYSSYLFNVMLMDVIKGLRDVKKKSRGLMVMLFLWGSSGAGVGGVFQSKNRSLFER
jgi:hypothetical protein